MDLTIWGCRGSLASPGPSTAGYGGNTSCVEVRTSEGAVIVLDAGTGIRDLGRRLVQEEVREIHLLLSHLHLDHLQGLAFFAPLYDRRVDLHIWGPPSPTRTLAERIGLYMSEPLFPVSLGDVPCRTEFHDAPDEVAFEVPGAIVYASKVLHRGSANGYRLEEHGGGSLVYIPDHEPALGGDLRRVDVSWLSGYGLAAGADVLLHDAQYTEAEYPDHVGWGHSSTAHVVAFARTARVRQLVLFHHDPSHSDADLDVIGARAAELWNAAEGPAEAPPPILAREGMTLAVTQRSQQAAASAR